MANTFLHDHHYQEINTNPQQFFEKLQQMHKTLPNITKQKSWGLSRSKEKTLPYTYTLKKDKDTTRIRPLVSYRKHPYRRMFNVVARAINFITSSLKIKHCNIEKCTDIKTLLENFQNQAYKKYRKHTRFAHKMGDIKNMYTELKHDVILEALDWAIQTFKSCTRSRNPPISIPKFGRKGAYIGRTSHSDEIYISFAEIRKIVKFDLHNAIFQLGQDTILKQLIGIPMGSPLSAALAPLVCIYFEHKLFSILDPKLTLIKTNGFRYMDDQIAIAAFDKRDPESKNQAITFVEKLATCYDDAMIMENEASNIKETGEILTSSEFDFLEATISICKSEITLKHLNKNKKMILESNKQKRFRYHHYHSYTPTNQMMGTVIGTIVRIHCYSSNTEEFIKSINLTIRELYSLSYPTNIIRKTLSKLYHKNKTKWFMLKTIIKNL